MHTVSVRKEDVVRKWYIVDAENQVVGRLASEVAKILRGKHKPCYTPHVDTGDYVIIRNALWNMLSVACYPRPSWGGRCSAS